MSTFRIALLTLSFLAAAPGSLPAKEAEFYFYTESLDQSILKPWVKVDSQASYQGEYDHEFGDGGGKLIINAHLKSIGGGKQQLVLDAVVIGPASILEKKPVKVVEDVEVDSSGVVRSGGKEVMKACSFTHPETKKEIRGFLIGEYFFKAGE